MESFFTYSILVLGILAMVHFVYEAILLPSLRQKQRFRLFALRDQLRDLKCEHSHQLDDETFHALDDSLSWQIDNQSRLTLSLMCKVEYTYENDPEFRNHVKHRLEILNRCKLETFIQIRKKAAHQYLDTILINSGVWVLAVVPLAVVYLCTAFFLTRAGRLIALPKSELNQYAASPA